MNPGLFFPILILHVLAVTLKLAVFFFVPRLKNVEEVRRFLGRYRPYERTADWLLWITGALLLYVAGWRMLLQSWMLISIGLYLIVFLAIRFALMKELEKISDSKKIIAGAELARLRTSNWCVAILSVGILAIIAYFMMVKP
jgi:hypothetical protein